MNKNGMKKQLTITAGFLLLGCAPALAGAQGDAPGNAPGPLPPPLLASREARLSKEPHTADDFAGLKYTDEQKAKIEQIHQTAKQRIEVVKKDEKLAPEVKEAMVDGYFRIELHELFEVLTPEQQKEVLKKAAARRAALQPQEPRKQNRPPTPQ